MTLEYNDKPVTVVDPTVGIKDHWRLTGNNIYALSVVNTKIAQSGFNTAATVILNSSNSANGDLSSAPGISEATFRFRMNPANLTQDAPPAVTIQPTFGGTFIEHQGQPYSNISISGTTGLRPGALPQQSTVLGVSVPAFLGGMVGIDKTRGLPQGETTGFDDLRNLRSLFKRYFARKTSEAAGDIVMLWTNAKMGDAYVVEPIGSGLTIIRDKSSPLTASYQISLRTISPVAAYITGSLVRHAEGAGGFFGFIQKVTQLATDLRQTFNFIQSVTSRVVQIAQGTVNSVMSVLSSVTEGLAGVISGAASAINVPRYLLSNAISSILSIANAIDSVLSSIDAYSVHGVTSELSQVKSAFLRALRITTGLATEKQLFAAPSAAVTDRRRDAYGTRTASSALASTPRRADVVNQPAPSGAAYTYIRPTDTLRSIALRILGDASQWHVIAQLNNLVAPYISAAGDGYSVLRPGQQILVPSAGNSGQGASISPATQQYPFVDGTSMDEVLGVDAKLVSFGGQGTMDSFDLELDQSGDVARIRGQDNMNQAVTLKFATEHGELPLHPEFGAVATVGSRVRAATFGAINLATRIALLSDPRIVDISNLSVSIDGDTLRYAGAVTLKGGAGSLSLNYVVR